MTTASALPLKNPKAESYGHSFDLNRHWAASLNLAFSSYTTSAGAITRMNQATHYGPLRV
ncbi:hypothetical protein CWE15_00640 [Aliidiomarina taiwanensis]|uniref:Uncharacterized protein n=1 Tax=Aliidiomarina taiwanensis TaxID=946228 RepID=A0A432X8U8_9GAMM|nr:hypothetical protein [Aliidiomarina taiwanensis]RUO43744.1 hypothetical protein CWE15_00640 [Aliidiomarina taiwanensis]